MTTADDWDLYTFNEEGFRDAHDSGERTAIVLGDSFTYGKLADDNSTYPYLLDRWNPGTEFLNYGMSAYGTANQLMVYRNLSQRIDHELVVLGYYLGNDMKDNVQDIPKRPKFVMEDGEAVLESLPRNKAPEGGTRGDPGLISNPAIQRIQNWLRRNVHTYMYIQRRIGIMLSGSGYRPPPTGDEKQRQLELTRALVEKISERAEREGADLLIVTIPTKTDAIQEKNRTGRERYWEAQREMLSHIAVSTANTEMVELRSALKSADESGKQVYGPMNAHLTEEGYRVAARTIQERLSSDGFLEAGPDPDFSRSYEIVGSGCPT